MEEKGAVEQEGKMGVARAAEPTVSCIDQYCECYRDLFPDVRSFEHFKYLHIGMLSEVKRKTLPAIAKVAGLSNAQGLHHFLAESPWETEALRERRLSLLAKALQGKTITICIDETGDRKKGKSTDYVARQYIGNLGKVENGIVSVNAYGILGSVTFPLLFKVYKPKSHLKQTDVYQSKPELAIEILNELKDFGFRFNLVLADSLYGESSKFIATLHAMNVKFVVAIRSNHGVWMPVDEKVRFSQWKEFERFFSNGKTQKRYIREFVFGQQQEVRYYEITTDREKQPKETTWYVMSDLEGELQKQVGNIYGLRTWIEYGLKQSKNELGWADYRVTDYPVVERWWEIVFSVYLMVSLQTEVFQDFHQSTSSKDTQARTIKPELYWHQHPQWDPGKGWKNILNNLRLIIQPYVSCCTLRPWIGFCNLRQLWSGFLQLINITDLFPFFVPI